MPELTSQLTTCISVGTEKSLRLALALVNRLSDAELNLRDDETRSTFLHQLVNAATDIKRRCGSLKPVVPIIYRLAIRGLNINAQNSHGNTALHLALIKPQAVELCQHLIRIGIDPCILNKRQCRVIHTYRHHACQLVKGQTTALSGLWKAVDRENVELCEKLLRSWCRVNVRRNKSLQDVADETGNVTIIRKLKKYALTNEMVCTAFACDEDKLKEVIRMGGFKIDYEQNDEAWDVPKPLLVALEELGPASENVRRILQERQQSAADVYCLENDKFHHHFENSEFHRLISSGTESDLNKALELLEFKEVDIRLVSFKEDTKHWTYLHFIVQRYNEMTVINEELARLLVRCLYRLALLGVDVNARAANGFTALHLASTMLDQNLITHVIRIGGDPSLCTAEGEAVNEEKYKDRGKLVFDKQYQRADLPGLWPAVDMGDVKRTERWLKSWCRVNVHRGDRTMLQVVQSKSNKDVVKLLEKYEHINEFVCATFACDLKRMMNLIALGRGQHKVNTIDDFFHVGFTWDRHAEFIQRPLVVAALELCTPEVIDFLLQFGADLSKQHEENAPCGPVAHWAFRNHVSNENALVVARHVDVTLRDECGATVLHRAIQKTRDHLQEDIVQTLLDRGVDVAARDDQGSTARDYTYIYDVTQATQLRKIIDNYILDLVCNDQHYKLETLMLDCYDHILDVRGTKKNKSAKELAHLKEFKEVIVLLDDLEDYRSQIDLLHDVAVKGDIMTISKLSGEKRYAWGRDRGGRTLLHVAVLYEHPDLVRFLVEQYPNLTNTTDSCGRTPLHYCVTLKERHRIWPILQDAGADPNLVDRNNLSVYDYVRELETPTPKKEKVRGRRWQDYRPENLIDAERSKTYGAKAQVFEKKHFLLQILPSCGLSDVKALLANFKEEFLTDDVDKDILKACVHHKREEIAKYLIENHGCRWDVTFQSAGLEETTLKALAAENKMSNFLEFIETKSKTQLIENTEETN